MSGLGKLRTEGEISRAEIERITLDSNERKSTLNMLQWGWLLIIIILASGCLIGYIIGKISGTRYMVELMLVCFWITLLAFLLGILFLYGKRKAKDGEEIPSFYQKISLDLWNTPFTCHNPGCNKTFNLAEEWVCGVCRGTHTTNGDYSNPILGCSHPSCKQLQAALQCPECHHCMVIDVDRFREQQRTESPTSGIARYVRDTAPPIFGFKDLKPREEKTGYFDD